MAQIKLAPGIISIHGSFGGVYFKRGSDGQHVQAMPRAVRKYKMLYPRTYSRNPGWSMAYGINAFSGMAALWSLALLAFFGAAWAAYALVYMFIDPSGEKKRISGYNWYMHYAMMFPEADYFPFWKPPHAPDDLPHYVGVYRGHWQFEHIPFEWPVDCCGGFFWPGMDWNNKPSYRTDDYEWFIWWRGDFWVVSKSLGWEDPPTTFYSPGTEIKAWYYNPVSKKYAHIYPGRRELE